MRMAARNREEAATTVVDGGARTCEHFTILSTLPGPAVGIEGYPAAHKH